MPRNAHRISIKQTLADMGFKNLDEAIGSGALADSVVPACCDEGCQVEPDGRCEHGCPAITLALGVI